MAKVKVAGVPGLDGEYEFDGTTFTNRELRTIKQQSGVRAGEIVEALKAGDNDVVVAITQVVLQRHGKPAAVAETLWDAVAGKIEFVADEKPEADAFPPASTPPDGNG